MSHAGVISIERDLPAVLGFLRACSGLIAIIALLGVVVGTTLAGRLERERPLLVPAATSNLALIRGGPAGAAEPSLERPRIVVLYLVETLEQAKLADLGENDFVADSPHRSYRTFFGVEEFWPGAQRVVEEMLTDGAPGLVQVVDLRDID